MEATKKTRKRRKADAPPQPATWEDAVRRFAAHLAEIERSEHTVRNYSDDLRAFAAWYRRVNQSEPVITTLTGVDAKEWKGYLLNGSSTPLVDARAQPRPDPRAKVKHAPQTVNRKLAALRSCLKWVEGQEWGDKAPHVPKSIRQEVPPPRWLERKERLALLREVERGGVPRDIALIATMYHVGLRISEVAAMTVESIDMSARKGSVEVVGKGRKHRSVPLNPDVRAALRSLIDWADIEEGPIWHGQRGPLSANAIWRIVAKYGRRAGIDLTPHELRHTFCRMLAEKGVRLEQIAALAGHESIETTRRYVEPGKEDLRSAVWLISNREE
jgi:site-specific recombinase XerD